MSRLRSRLLHARRLRGTGVGGAAVALLLGVLATAAVALAASVALDPAGAAGYTAREYRPSPVVQGIAPFAVTSAEVVAAGSGTPGAALLRWWQTMQLSDAAAPGAAQLVPPTDAAQRRRVARELSAIRYLFTESKPRLIDHEQQGDRARVLAVIARADPSARGREAHQLAQFDLQRVAGRWRISPQFVRARYRAELAFAREQEQP